MTPHCNRSARPPANPPESVDGPALRATRESGRSAMLPASRIGAPHACVCAPETAAFQCNPETTALRRGSGPVTHTFSTEAVDSEVAVRRRACVSARAMRSRGQDRRRIAATTWCYRKDEVLSADPGDFHLQETAELGDPGCDVAEADGTVVSGAVTAPFLDEPPCAEREPIAAVCVADLEDGARYRFRLGHEKLEAAVRRPPRPAGPAGEPRNS
jgi:hypothetical protein